MSPTKTAFRFTFADGDKKKEAAASPINTMKTKISLALLTKLKQFLIITLNKK